MLTPLLVRPLLVGSVVQLNVAPKHRAGRRRNLKWSVVYNRNTRRYQWRGEYTANVQVFTGECATDAAADEEVQKYLKILPK